MFHLSFLYLPTVCERLLLFPQTKRNFCRFSTVIFTRTSASNKHHDESFHTTTDEFRLGLLGWGPRRGEHGLHLKGLDRPKKMYENKFPTAVQFGMVGVCQTLLFVNRCKFEYATRWQYVSVSARAHMRKHDNTATSKHQETFSGTGFGASLRDSVIRFPASTWQRVIACHCSLCQYGNASAWQPDSLSARRHATSAPQHEPCQLFCRSAWQHLVYKQYTNMTPRQLVGAAASMIAG